MTQSIPIQSVSWVVPTFITNVLQIGTYLCRLSYQQIQCFLWMYQHRTADTLAGRQGAGRTQAGKVHTRTGQHSAPSPRCISLRRNKSFLNHIIQSAEKGVNGSPALIHALPMFHYGLHSISFTCTGLKIALFR